MTPLSTADRARNGTLTRRAVGSTGLVFQSAAGTEDAVAAAFAAVGVPCVQIGAPTNDGAVCIKVDGAVAVAAPMAELRDVWEATGFELEMLQAHPACVAQERDGLKSRVAPPYKLTFEPKATDWSLLQREAGSKPKVAVLREEGSNGDREMSCAFFAAGFDVWDVTVSDLRRGVANLAAFRGLVFVGGFSHASSTPRARPAHSLCTISSSRRLLLVGTDGTAVAAA